MSFADYENEMEKCETFECLQDILHKIYEDCEKIEDPELITNCYSRANMLFEKYSRKFS